MSFLNSRVLLKVTSPLILIFILIFIFTSCNATFSQLISELICKLKYPTSHTHAKQPAVNLNDFLSLDGTRLNHPMTKSFLNSQEEDQTPTKQLNTWQKDLERDIANPQACTVFINNQICTDPHEVNSLQAQHGDTMKSLDQNISNAFSSPAKTVLSILRSNLPNYEELEIKEKRFSNLDTNNGKATFDYTAVLVNRANNSLQDGFNTKSSYDPKNNKLTLDSYIPLDLKHLQVL